MSYSGYVYYSEIILLYLYANSVPFNRIQFFEFYLNFWKVEDCNSTHKWRGDNCETSQKFIPPSVRK